MNRSLIKHDKVWWYTNKVFLDVNSLDLEYSPGIHNYWGIELEALKIGNESQPQDLCLLWKDQLPSLTMLAMAAVCLFRPMPIGNSSS